MTICTSMLRLVGRVIFFMRRYASTPNPKPISGDTNNIFAQNSKKDPTVYWYPLIMLAKKKYRIMALPSFNNDSPAMMVVNFEEAFALFNNTTTDTGSVAHRIAPKRKQYNQGHPNGKQ